MSHRKRTPRTAAFLLSIAMGATALTMLPAADAAPQVHVAGAHAKVETTGPATLKRLSASKGYPGQPLIIQGTNLTTQTENEFGFPSTVAKTVKFGDTVIASDRVSAAGPSMLLVTVPAHANGPVTVTVGEATKGLKFTFAAPMTVASESLLFGDVDGLTIEKGLAAYTLEGTNFSKTTKVLVGGKTAKVAKDGVSADGTEITFAFPAGLVGVQDVVLVDSISTVLAGLVMYVPAEITATVTSGTSYVEAPSVIELSGTNLDLVATATYAGVKAPFKVVKGVSPKVNVTVPAGVATTAGDLVVTTKNGATVTVALDRVAAPVPSVTAVSTVAVSTVGEVTLTGTGLTGLKKVVVKNAAGKVFNGSKISVVSSTSAKVTLPALVAGDYTVQVFAISATGSTAFEFTVAAS